MDRGLDEKTIGSTHSEDVESPLLQAEQDFQPRRKEKSNKRDCLVIWLSILLVVSGAIDLLLASSLWTLNSRLQESRRSPYSQSITIFFKGVADRSS